MGGRRRTIYFFPGIGGYCAFHAAVIDELARYARVVRCDYGARADAADLSESFPRDWAARIAADSDRHPDTSSVIVACSYGTVQAARVAALLGARPVEVVLLSPAFPIAPGRPFARALARRLGRWLSPLVPWLAFRWSELTARDRTELNSARDALYRHGSPEAKRQLELRFRDYIDFAFSRPLADALRPLASKRPVIVGGSDDIAFRATLGVLRRALEAQSLRQVLIVPGGHALNLHGSRQLFQGFADLWDDR